VKGELEEVRETLSGEKRRTKVQASAEEPEYDAEAFIQYEDTYAVVTTDGWLKRVRTLSDPKSTRLREGDALLAVLQGSTKEPAVLFSNHGSAYVLKLHDVPPSTGYGEPVQKLFRLDDQERIVAAFSLDERVFPEKAVLLAVTRRGLVFRFEDGPFHEETTRSGRRYAKPAPGDEVAFVALCEKGDVAAIASEQGRAILFSSNEVPVLAGPGRGVLGIKLAMDDRVVGAAVFGKDEKRAVLRLESDKGNEVLLTRNYTIVGRGGKGFELRKRDRLVKVIPPEIELVELAER